MESEPLIEEVSGETPEGDEVVRIKKRTIVKSATPFPYVNLEDVAALAKAMSDKGGVPLARDQIADALNTHENGTFSLKIAAAKLFDAISFADGKFTLTEIGYRLASDDEDVVKVARRDAFWSVELYRKVYDHFRGKTLPPRNGIENVLISLGVSEKQAEKARQIFERSAQFAGYLSANKDRLVQPVITYPANGLDANKGDSSFGGKISPTTPKKEEKIPISGTTGDPLEELLIRGLLIRLPKVETVWDTADRVKWLRTLVANFDTIYQENPDEDGNEWEIVIGLKKSDY